MGTEMEVDSRAENPINKPPPHLGCESQNQSQSQREEEEEEEKEKKDAVATMIMLRKSRPFSSPSEADGGEFVTPTHSPSPKTTTTDDSDSSTIENTSSSGAVSSPTSSDIEFLEEVRFKRMSSLTSSSSSSGSSKQEVVLNSRHRHPPRSRLSSSPASFSTDLHVGEGHRLSNLEKIVRVLKRMHSSLRREYWSSPPTIDELRLHHLILIHVNSYISLFDIEQSHDGRPLAFSPVINDKETTTTRTRRS